MGIIYLPSESAILGEEKKSLENETQELRPDSNPNPLTYTDAEKGNAMSWYEGVFYGLGSGLFKIPEGFVSLGAEIYDLTHDTNTAAKAEKLFADINPWDELAQKTTVGKLTELVISFGVPAAAAAKLAVKLATKALRAKRAGTYANIKSNNIKEALEKVKKEELNYWGADKKLRASNIDRLNLLAKQKKYKYGAGLIGAGVGEAIVGADSTLRNTGSFFSGNIPGTGIAYPLTYDEGNIYGEKPSGSAEAWRRLKNRGKWGVEGGLFMGLLGGVGKSAKALYKRGDDLAYSDNAILRTLDKFASKVRPREDLPSEMFKKIRHFKGRKAAQEFIANRVMLDFNKSIDAIFPLISRSLNASTKQQRKEIYAKVNELLKNYKKGVPDKKILDELTDLLSRRGATGKQVGEVIENISSMRDFIDHYLRQIQASPTWGSTRTANELWEATGRGIGKYLEQTYEIMGKKGSAVFDLSKVGSEIKNKLITLIQRHARMKGEWVPDPTTGQQVWRPVMLSTGEAEDILTAMVKSTAEQVTTGSPRAKDIIMNFSDLSMGKSNILNRVFKPLYGTGKGKLKSEKQLSPFFRELFGEVKDPRSNYLETIMGLVATKTTDDFFQDLLMTSRSAFKNGIVRNEAGQVIGFKGPRPMIVPGDELAALNLSKGQEEALLKQIFPNQPTRKLEFAQGSRMGHSDLINPLANSYTTQLIAKNLEQFTTPAWAADSAQSFAQLAYTNMILFPKTVVNISKTVGGPFTHARNWISAAAFAFANGNLWKTLYNPVDVTRNLNEALATTQGPFKTFNSKAANKRYARLLELGVVNTNVTLGDLMRLVDDIGKAGGPLSYTATKEPLKVYQRMLKMAQDAYVAEDDFWKIFNFAMERSKLKRKFSKYTDDMLDEEAADIVRNTVPNYEYVGSLQRGIRRMPIGNFVSFPSEMIRTSFNIAELGIKEITRGIRTGNGRDVADGVLRLGGFGTGAIMGGEILQTTGQAIHDITDEQLDAMRRFVAPWAKNSPLFPAGIDEDGNYKFIDLGHILAYETVVKPARAILLEIAKGETDEERLLESLQDAGFRAAGEILEPFVSESIWTSLVLDLTSRGGKTRSGKKIWNPEDSRGTKAFKALQYVTTQILPLNYKQLTRLFKAAHGEQYDLENELWGTVGMRQQVIKLDKQLDYKIYDYLNSKKNANAYVQNIMYQYNKQNPDPSVMTPWNLINGYRNMQQAEFNAQRKLFLDIQAARALGMDDSEIRKEFGTRVTPRKALNSIMEGLFYPRQWSFKRGGTSFRRYLPSTGVKLMEQGEDEGVLPNPYTSEAKGAIEYIFDSNVGKSLVDDNLNPLS